MWVKWSTFKRRSLCIPGFLQNIQLFFLISCRKPHIFPLLFIHNFSQRSLCFWVEIFKGFAVLYLCGINLHITLNDSLPNILASLLKCQYYLFTILNGPHWVILLYPIVNLPVYDGLSFHLHLQGCIGEHHFNIFFCRSRGYFYSDCDILSWLAPLVFFSLASVICVEPDVLDLNIYILPPFWQVIPSWLLMTSTITVELRPIAVATSTWPWASLDILMVI